MRKSSPSAKAKARELQDLLLQKLRAFIQNLIEKAFAAMPASMTVGGRTLTLASMNYRRKISFSGAMKASLIEAAELVAAGELEVEFEYTAAPAPARPG